jgi:hypothetical protein
MKEYWADAGTSNCVFLFQVQVADSTEDDVGYVYWDTIRVFLTENDALNYGISQRHNLGEYGADWRVYGVPCDGQMAEILGRHTNEFQTKWKHRNDCQCPECILTGR